MMATGAMADDGTGTLCVHLKDGSRVRFVLPVEQPVVSCQEGVMRVDYQMGDGMLSTICYHRDEVAFLNVEKQGGVITGEMSPADARILFDLTRPGVLHVSGLKTTDRLQVYRLDGKHAKADTARHGDEATVDLSREPRGVYMVSVNNSFTFKLMKP